MLSNIPLPVICKDVFSKLSIRELILLKIAYVNSSVVNEINLIIQKKLQLIQENILYDWAEYITNYLVEQYEMLYKQIATGKPIGLWRMDLNIGEHIVFLHAWYKDDKGFYKVPTMDPNIQFMVYKKPVNENPEEHFHIDINEIDFIVNEKFYKNTVIHPDIWKKKTKDYILTVLKTEYSLPNLNSYIHEIDIQGLIQVYKKCIEEKKFYSRIVIGIFSEECDECDQWYYNESYSTEKDKGYDTLKYMKKNYRGKKKEQAWMKRLVFPISAKMKKLVDDIAKSFREPQFLWMK
jgi:hypothetical protein